MPTSTARFLIAALLLVLAGCSSLTIEQVDFAWPVESVETVNSMNRIEARRYALTLDVLPIAVAEFQDSSALLGATLRIIRNREGYYFITGPAFRNVYVFKPGAGSLILHTAIEVSSTGLRSPAFNQRPPVVELLDEQAPPRRLTPDGLVEEITR